jgi:MbtH protein
MTPTDTQPDALPDASMHVVVNDEEQYSVWWADTELPAGWRREGFTGSREECLAHIAGQGGEHMHESGAAVAVPAVQEAVIVQREDLAGVEGEPGGHRGTGGE